MIFKIKIFKNLYYFLPDIDECKENIHECQIRTECINKIGTYACVCKRGYIGNGVFCEGF